MSAYAVVLTTSSVPEPPHEIRSQGPCLLLIYLFQYGPYPLYMLLPLDAREGGARDTRTDDLLDGSLFLLPAIGILYPSDFTLVLVGSGWGVVVDVIVDGLRL